jgi:hypothetical protein
MKRFFIATILGTVFFSSCKKDLLDTAPYDNLASATMWSSDNLTEQGVNGIYNALRLGQAFSGASGLEIYQYDRFGVTGQGRDADAMMQGTITPGNALFSNNWRNFYEGVIRANDAIANIPAKSPSSADRKARFLAEAKFLRAYFYFRLNQVWKGVPLYLDPVTFDEFTKPRSTEQEVWNQVIADLTDCINEARLPSKYASSSPDYGRVTKGAAYALRGKVYMYTKEWANAAADFQKVKEAGFTLFTAGGTNTAYYQLFKEANERSDEMIFSLQNISVDGLGSTTAWYAGSRATMNAGGWNNYFVSPDLVDLYEYTNGDKFNWDAVIPGYSSMTPKARRVFFLRNNLTATEISGAAAQGADMSKYLPTGNEARLQAAYQGRDPRLMANVITPYSTYAGHVGSGAQTVTLRVPYRGETSPNFDLRIDGNIYAYLYRKFVPEGPTEFINRQYGPVDLPLIRYADVLLMWAEALNEQGDVPGAIEKVNEVRTRVGMPALQQSNSVAGTYVLGQTDLRDRIRNERRAEFPNEGISYFDELRWKTWKESSFKTGSGSQLMWGENIWSYNWAGDWFYAWPIPQVEIERNPSLTQNDGWPR